MSTRVLVAWLLASSAIGLTTHIAIVYGLLTSGKAVRAPLALFIPPLAPYWAAVDRMWVRAGLWVVALCAYVAARVVERL